MQALKLFNVFGTIQVTDSQITGKAFCILDDEENTVLEKDILSKGPATSGATGTVIFTAVLSPNFSPDITFLGVDMEAPDSLLEASGLQSTLKSLVKDLEKDLR